MKILVLEDEIPAYEKLLSFITQELPDSQVIGWARSTSEAKLLLKRTEQPDLIFSDIELLDGVSFEVFESIRISCPIIFCTGFDQYVLRAFQTNGIAYLLKPYTIENFREALDKYKTLFKQKDTKPVDEALMVELKAILHNDKKSYKQRFTIKKKDGIKLINTREIACFEANGDFSMAFDNKGSKHIINDTLSNIEEKIDPRKFFRINRSQIINIDFVEKIESHFKNKLAITILNISNTMFTSSKTTPAFRKWIDG